jgi:hypothetical protein
MADRYQDRNFMADDLDRGMTPRGPARGESDPLAELARLIGQNDPFAGSGRPAAPKVQPRAPAAPVAPEPVRPPQASFDDPLAAAGPPPWVQRGGGQAPRPPQLPAEPDGQGSVHPVHRYGAPNAATPNDFQEEAFADEEDQPDPSRYDETLFGQVDDGAREFRREQGYSDDGYGFEEDGYDEGEDEGPKKGGGLSKIAMVLALAVIGTGGAFAYRALVSSPRNGEPPIIRADNGPTKIVPAQSDGNAKVPDRLSVGGEKMVSREETPVDVNTRGVAPRVVFPSLSQSTNSPAPPTNMASNDPPPMSPPPMNMAPTNSGATPASEPRRIKTFSVRGDQADASAAAAPAAAAPAAPRSKAGRKPPASANASADAPMSLSPQAQASAAPAAEPRMASASSAQSADSASPAAAGYMVQVSSQPSEAGAQASYKALQTKYSDVLGQYSSVIQRADGVPGKGTVYRAMVGPFGTSAEAVQLCTSLKTAGGQCFVPRK